MATRSKLSPHFVLAEFDCHDGSPVPTSCIELLRHDLVRQVLEPARERFGGPCIVHSGFRGWRYNSGIGGALDSRHIYRPSSQRGLAADVSFASGTPDQWRRWASARLDDLGWGGGVGYYPQDGYVHLDSRRVRARW